MIKTLLFLSLTGSALFGQNPQWMKNLRVPHLLAEVDTANETVSSLVHNLPVPTGLTDSLGLEGWFSPDSTLQGALQENLLIVGVDLVGNGSIKHFARPYASTTVPYVEVSSASLGALVEPSGVAYDEASKQLYFIDRVSRMVHRFAWDDNTALPVTPASPWFDASSHVPDGSPSLQLLGGHDPELEQLRTGPASELRVTPRITAVHQEMGIPPWVIVDVATVQDTMYVEPAVSGDNFILDHASVRDGAIAVTIVVGKGYVHSFVLKRADTGAVLGTALQALGDEEVTIPSSTPLEVGERYSVERDGQTSDTSSVRCMVQIGSPGDVTGLGQVEMGRLVFDTEFRAGADLMMSCPAVSASGGPVTVITSIVWNSSVPGSGVYPVVPVGGDVYLIQNATSLPIGISELNGSFASWIFYEPLYIPNVPGAAGSVFVMQSVVVDGSGGIYVSNVFGGKVLPASP